MSTNINNHKGIEINNYNDIEYKVSYCCTVITFYWCDSNTTLNCAPIDLLIDWLIDWLIDFYPKEEIT